MAAAAFLEVLNFSDVAAEIAELSVGDYVEAFHGISPRNVATVIRNQPVNSLAGAAGLTGMVGLKPALVGLARAVHPRPRRYRPGTSSRDRAPKNIARKPTSKFTTSSTGHRRISTGYRIRTMPYTKKRKYSTRRTRRASKYNKKPYGGLNFTASNTNRIAGSGHALQQQVVVKKMLLGPTPTVRGTTSLDFNIANHVLKTTPDGQGSFGYAFKLDQFTNFSEYSALYQWYKILGVRLTFYPEQNAYQGIGAQPVTGSTKYTVASTTNIIQSIAPVMVIAPDQTTDAAFTSINDAMAHHNARFHSFNDGKEFSVYLSPKPNSLVGQQDSEVITLASGNKWITTDSSDVKHYGLRCFVDRFTDQTSLYCVAEMKIAFKAPKT